VLAMVGLYGVLSYGVSRRTGEIGVRIALGASRSSVWGMVVRESVLVVATGLGAGLGLAYGTTRVLASALYDLKPYDPATFVEATLILFGASILAIWIPARRASMLDPMVALRHD
jgi:ABC-type antimicrobial peptide transport system permease subunit